MEEQKGFTLIELLAVIVILTVITLIATPIILNIIAKAYERARIHTANNVLEAAGYFFTESIVNADIVYPSTGLEFICDGNNCKATIGNTTVDPEEGIAMLTEEEPIVYILDFTGKVPSSGSVLVFVDGTVTPKNLAIDSHVCIYDGDKKIFVSC